MIVIIELVFPIYFVLLLVRLLVPDTGQMTFNLPYRFIVKLTRPVIDNLARLLPPSLKRLSPWLAIALLILLQGFFYSGDSGIYRVFQCGFARLFFASNQPLWGVGKSLLAYLLLLYRLYLFLLFVVLLSPLLNSSDQTARLIKLLLQPFEKVLKLRWLAPALLFAVFVSALGAAWRFYQAIGWVTPQKAIFLKAIAGGLTVPVQLISVVNFLIIARAIFSWFAAIRPYRGPGFWLESITDPFLKPFKRMGLTAGNFDLTPLMAIFALYVLQRLLLIILAKIFQTIL